MIIRLPSNSFACINTHNVAVQKLALSTKCILREKQAVLSSVRCCAFNRKVSSFFWRKRFAQAESENDDIRDVSEKEELPYEAREYWEEVMQAIDKPDLKPLVESLVPGHLLGVHKNGQGRTVNCYREYIKHKRNHPCKIVLMQVGDFFEAVGYDALVLCQYVALNPMGRKPQAGTPLVNLRHTLDKLLECGFSVVVVTEVGSTKSGTKVRKIAGIVTPHNPVFGSDTDSDRLAPPLVGIAASKLGLILYELSCNARPTLVVSEGLTREALLARLHALHLKPPVLVHKSVLLLTPPGPGGRVTFDWRAALASVVCGERGDKRGTPGLVMMLQGDDPLLAFQQFAQREFGVMGDMQMVTHKLTDRPRPPPLSTVAQLGLTGVAGAPPLMDALLLPSTAALAREWLRGVLLVPPPDHVARSIHASVRILAALDEGLPSQVACISTQVLSDLISRGSADDEFFRKLTSMLEPAVELLEPPQFAELVHELLVAATWQDPRPCPSPAELLAAWRQTLQLVHATVPSREDLASLGTFSDTPTDLESEDPSDAEGTAEEGVDAMPAGGGKKPDGGLQWSISRMRRACEAFRLLVREDVNSEIEAAYARVERGRENVMKEVIRVALALKGDSSSPWDGVCVVYSTFDRAVWLEVLSKKKVKSPDHLIHPTNSKGKKAMSKYWSTEELEEALETYRLEAATATELARSVLRSLCASLEPHSAALAVACRFSAVALALENHVRAAMGQGWALPALLTAGAGEAQGRAAASGEDHSGFYLLDLKDAWPYWKERGDLGTICNSIALSGMKLMTGPNMGGKSTQLRVIASCALLGGLGLMIPAQSGSTVPRYDGIVLRNFAGDSALEGKSSFLLEAEDMAMILSSATQRSLVLLDELGKGTEPHAGAALGARMIAELVERGVNGVFATHLHMLPGMMAAQVQAGRLECWRMDVAWREEAGRVRLRPTCKLAQGVCGESLAFEVAEDAGLPRGFVEDARRTYEQLKREAEDRSNPVHDSAMLQSSKTCNPMSSQSRLLENGSQAIKIGHSATMMDPIVPATSSDPGFGNQSTNGNNSVTRGRKHETQTCADVSANSVLSTPASDGAVNDIQRVGSLLLDAQNAMGLAGARRQPKTSSQAATVHTSLGDLHPAPDNAVEQLTAYAVGPRRDSSESRYRQHEGTGQADRPDMSLSPVELYRESDTVSQLAGDLDFNLAEVLTGTAAVAAQDESVATSSGLEYMESLTSKNTGDSEHASSSIRSVIGEVVTAERLRRTEDGKNQPVADSDARPGHVVVCENDVTGSASASIPESVVLVTQVSERTRDETQVGSTGVSLGRLEESMTLLQIDREDRERIAGTETSEASSSSERPRQGTSDGDEAAAATIQPPVRKRGRPRKIAMASKAACEKVMLDGSHKSRQERMLTLGGLSDFIVPIDGSKIVRMDDEHAEVVYGSRYASIQTSSSTIHDFEDSVTASCAGPEVKEVGGSLQLQQVAFPCPIPSSISQVTASQTGSALKQDDASLLFDGTIADATDRTGTSPPSASQPEVTHSDCQASTNKQIPAPRLTSLFIAHSGPPTSTSTLHIHEIVSSQSSTDIEAPELQETLALRRFHTLRRLQSPPPAHCMRSAVYVYQAEDGMCYCGETDNIYSRVRQHRRAAGRGTSLEFVYVLLERSEGGKSAARQLETTMIKLLIQRGVPLKSIFDSQHRNFGGHLH